jgi:alkylhydroperoxidase family enzyme
VPDDVWDEASRHFDPDELAHLVFAIGAVNLWNRTTVAARTLPASYVPAQAA